MCRVLSPNAVYCHELVELVRVVLSSSVGSQTEDLLASLSLHQSLELLEGSKGVRLVGQEVSRCPVRVVVEESAGIVLPTERLDMGGSHEI